MPRGEVSCSFASALPRVTEVLAAVGLAGFEHVHAPLRQASMDRGRLAHQAICFDIAGDLDEDSAREAGVFGYVEAARAVRAALGVLIADAVEHHAVHERLGYQGTIDLVAGDMIVDWKTGTAEYWVRFQLAAYAALLEQEGAGAAKFRRIAAELHQDGSYRLFEIPQSEWLEDFQTFCAALRIYREKTNRRALR
jgi:hypothetical protein